MTVQPTPNQVDGEELMSLGDFVGVLRKNWWLLFLLLVVGATGAAFYSFGQTRIYRASTTIQIDPAPAKPLGRDVQGAVDIGTTPYANTDYYQTQYEILEGRSLALKTVRRLGLHLDQTFVLHLPPGATLPEAQAAEPFTEERARAALSSRLQIVPVKESRLVEIHLEDADPERALRVLRTLVEIYIDDNVDSVIESTNVAAQWLDQQLGKLKGELSDNELALHSFKRDKQILSVSLDDQNNMLSNEMQQLSTALTSVQAELERLRARQEQLATIDVEEPGLLPSRELLDSNVLTNLRADYIKHHQELEALLGGGKGSLHPTVTAARSNVAVARQALLTEVMNIRGALRRELETKKSEEAGLTRLLSHAKARALELNRLGLEYRRLERAKDNTEKIYSLVLERSKESDLTRFMRFNNIRVVDEAYSYGPVRPRHAINIAVGGLGGLILALMIGFGRHIFDRTFKTGEDVELHLGLPLLGILPRTAGDARSAAMRRRNRRNSIGDELVVHRQPNSTAAEAARAVRTNLTFASPDKPQRSLVVTSGSPLEGKTTVACWIAITLAQTGKRVLLLDCDLRRPRLHKIFERINDVGISTFVVEPSLLDKSDCATEIPHLHLITAGPGVPNPAELLQSDRFHSLLNTLKERYDHIVLDTPPVNAVTDAAILSTQVDATLLVVRAHNTPRDAARYSARALLEVTDNLVGVVLNAFDQRKAGYNYGYGYGRYHHYYGNRDAS